MKLVIVCDEDKFIKNDYKGYDIMTINKTTLRGRHNVSNKDVGLQDNTINHRFSKSHSADIIHKAQASTPLVMALSVAINLGYDEILIDGHICTSVEKFALTEFKQKNDCSRVVSNYGGSKKIFGSSNREEDTDA